MCQYDREQKRFLKMSFILLTAEFNAEIPNMNADFISVSLV